MTLEDALEYSQHVICNVCGTATNHWVSVSPDNRIIFTCEVCESQVDETTFVVGIGE